MVRQAAAEARPKPAPARRARWRRWNAKLLTLAAAVVTAVGRAAGLLASRSGSGPSVAIVPHPAAGQADGGWPIQLTVRRLPDLGPGRFYECWYAGPGSRPGHPQLIEAPRLYARHGYREAAPFSSGLYADHWFEKTLP